MAGRINLGMGAGPVFTAIAPSTPIPLVNSDTPLGSATAFDPRMVPTTQETGRVQGTLPTRYGRREAAAPPPAMAMEQAAPPPAPAAPVAPQSALGGMGGLGGMGSTIGDAMQALGASMMSGRHGDWTSGFAQNMDALQGRRREEAERATQMRAMQGALVELGFSPEEAAQYAGTPEAAQLVLQAREQARTRAERERMLSGAREAEAALRGGGAPAPTQGAGAFPAIGSPEALGLPSGAFGESGAQPAPAAAPAPAPMPGASLPPEWEDANRMATQYGALAAQYEAAGDPVNAARMTSLAQEYEARRDLIAQRMPPVEGRPTEVLEFEYGQQNPEFFDRQDAMLRSGATRLETGTIPPGYRAVRDDAGNIVQYELIPGSPQAREAAGITRAFEMASSTYDNKFGIVNDALDRAIGMLQEYGGAVAGPGSLISPVPGSPARDFQATIDTIKANLGFEELQAMRDASPTGGALGNITERELAYLQSVQGNLDAAQSPAQLMEVMQDIRTRRAEFRAERERILRGEAAPERSAPSEPRDPNAIPAGIDPADWEMLTPEERALWN